jgi:hypothetical protein
MRFLQPGIARQEDDMRARCKMIIVVRWRAKAATGIKFATRAERNFVSHGEPLENENILGLMQLVCLQAIASSHSPASHVDSVGIFISLSMLTQNGLVSGFVFAIFPTALPNCLNLLGGAMRP